jgi:2-methylcitrate dehydratase PrpD
VTYSEDFARFVLDTRYDSLPPAVVALMKDAVVDHLGVQLFASRLHWNQAAYEYAREFGAPGTCTVMGKSDKLKPPDAAFVNGTFGQGCELDDFGHAGAATVPVALALAEDQHASGADLLTAVAIGYEIFARLYEAGMPDLNERGFHAQCVLGVFASTAVAGKLLGLSFDQLVHAFGVAGSHSSGTCEYDQSGGEVKRVHAGLGSKGGVQSALLAQRGLTGPPTILEGKRGILNTFLDHYRPEGIVSDLGRRWDLLPFVTFKPYATLGMLHTSIQALDEILKANPIKPDEVERIDVGLHEYLLMHGATIVEPHDNVSSQFSLAYSLALRLVKGSNDLDLYLDEKLWHDPEVIGAARKVKAYANAEATGDKKASARMKVQLKEGRTLENYQPYRKGSQQNPFTPDELMGKFLKLSTSLLARPTAERLAAQIYDIEKLASVERLSELLAMR